MWTFFVSKLSKSSLYRQLLVYVKSSYYPLCHEADYFILLMSVMASVMLIMPAVMTRLYSEPRNSRLGGFRPDPASTLCGQEGNLKTMSFLSSWHLPSQKFVLFYVLNSENEIFRSVDWHLSLRSKGTIPVHTSVW